MSNVMVDISFLGVKTLTDAELILNGISSIYLVKELFSVVLSLQSSSGEVGIWGQCLGLCRNGKSMYDGEESVQYTSQLIRKATYCLVPGCRISQGCLV